jgi:hypothetical protein
MRGGNLWDWGLEVELLEAAVEAVLFLAERSLLAGEVSDLLPKCAVFRGLVKASERRLDFDVGDEVRTEATASKLFSFWPARTLCTLRAAGWSRRSGSRCPTRLVREP